MNKPKSDTVDISEIRLMREVVVKVTRVLSGKSVRVTQQGTNAFVVANAQGQPTRVNIPCIPDNATRELLIAIQGFLDHEVAHILFTDFALSAKVQNGRKTTGCEERKDKMICAFENILEDCWIEDAMGKRFDGSVANLEDTRKFVISKVSEPDYQNAVKSGDAGAITSTLLPMALRALRGHSAAVEWMKDKWHHFGHFEGVMKGFAPAIKAMNSTQDALTLAERVYNALTPPRSCASPSKEKGDKQQSVKSSGDNKDQEKEQSDEENKDEDDGKGQGKGKGKKDEKEQEDESEGAGEGGSDEESKEDEDNRDGAGDSDGDKSDDGDPDDDGGDKESEDSGKGEKPEKKSDSEDDAGLDGTDAEDSDAESEGQASDGVVNEGAAARDADDTSDAKRSEKRDSEQGSPSGGAVDEVSELPIDTDKIKDLDKAAAGAIADTIKELIGGEYKNAPYLPYSRDLDYIGPLWHTNLLDRGLSEFPVVEKAERFSHGLQSEMQKVFIARSASHWQPGLRRGKINRHALHRLSTGDDRIFRQKMQSTTQDVAVELLIDNSGSMCGRKIQNACIAAYIFSDILDKVKVANEVLSFSTMINSAGPLGKLQERNELVLAGREELRKGTTFSRIDPLTIYVLKSFQARFGMTERRQLAALPMYDDALMNNVDGECVEIAAQRLLQRKEKRKILIVFSDGCPAADCYSGGVLDKHLKTVIENAERAGIEVFGLGLEDHSVKRFYKHHEIVMSADQIPEKILGILRKMVLHIA